MRTYAQKQNSTPKSKTSDSTRPIRTLSRHGREVTSILHLQRTTGNQAKQRSSQVNHEKRDESSLNSASSHFTYDFSRIPVHVRQVRDMEGLMPEGDTDRLVDTDGGSAPTTGPPVATPSPPSPAAPVGPPAAPASINVTVPGRIRAASTPAGMPDRIPPRIDTPVSVGITGWSVPMRNVTISVEGTGGGNGTVTINGANSVDLNSSATVNLRGVNQTGVGNAGRLRLVARQGPVLLASSTGFSVSSIPQNWSVSFHSLITGGRRGIRVNNNWQSDSGNVADLDQAERSEQVQYDAGSGSLAGAGAGAHNSGYLPANNPPLTDSHGAGVGLLTGVGSIAAEQTFIFKDRRTGANNIPARNSGFRITRNITEPTPGNLEITTTKQGTATTANGFASSAGSGSVSRTQAV